ncbi:hypothetical protein EHO59_04735 [Leptospira semungkisensis]|uniref:Uncharacterized protein n=1 Tax=Leptospira semungkisensis TaxID=2484985 RepID=A0A4R9G7G7_9LEPT|nr:DUF6368 family protein [Leptospira semungkisensis]TGK07411.1 hypothetical protein EHO59_04735 [Leptospira semungkisensis]
MGPVISIASPFTLDSNKIDEVTKLIASSAEKVQNQDFWIKSRPFYYSNKLEYSEILEDYKDLAKFLNWRPKSVYYISAGCNDILDHLILGNIAFEFCKLLEGVILFGSLLSNYTSDNEILNNPNLIHYHNETIFKVREFELWMLHPDFRLVK